MKFLRVPVTEAIGGVLAHNLIDADGRRVLFLLLMTGCSTREPKPGKPKPNRQNNFLAE
jgi:hypothetical protein